MVQLDEDQGKFCVRSVIDHPYPTTKIQWIPDQVLCVCSIRVVDS